MSPVSRIQRGGFIFVTFVGDHAPRHIHDYRDRKFVVKWDLEHSREMEGRVTRAVLRHINSLIEEGRL